MADATAPPARAWHRRVVDAAALKGWTKTELAERAGVARSTIDGWDSNPRPPQAKKVTAVADALGIPRAEALQLAGIIAAVPDPGPEPPQELIDAYGQQVINAMLETVTDAAQRQRLFDRLMDARREGGTPPSGPGAATPPGGTQRLA